MSRNFARQLAAAHLSRGDVTGWFEALYGAAGDSYASISWADLRPNSNLVSWSQQHALIGAGRRALVVGCGYGDDAEFLAEAGFSVLAFDVAPTAVAQCRKRFPDSTVDYRVANLLELPVAWSDAFDCVLEIYTLQVLPPTARPQAMANIVRTMAPGGQLLVLARGRDEEEPGGDMPWPLTRRELDQFVDLGLHALEFEDFMDAETPPVRRFRVHYWRPAIAQEPPTRL